jgi:hypothetical protein
MSTPDKQATGPTLADLAPLADVLAEAIADGDVQSAQEAHTALGRGLDTVSEQPSGVVDLARERKRRAGAHRKVTR